MPLARTTMLAAALLAQIAQGENLNDPLDNCPRGTHAIAAHQDMFNSTGEAPFTLSGLQQQQRPWYLTLTFRDERAHNTQYDNSQATRQTLGVVVSVPETLPRSPEGARTSICVYRLAQQNGTAAAAANDAQASCAGVLSDGCVKALSDAPAAPTSDGSCPVPDVSAACGSGVKVIGSTNVPIVFNNTLCSTNATLPGAESIPDGYQNYFTFASGQVSDTDGSQSSFTEYSRRITQPAPVLIAARLGGRANSTSNSTESTLLCLAPSKVAPGSRAAAAVSAGGGAAVSALFGGAKPLMLTTIVSCIVAAAL